MTESRSSDAPRDEVLKIAGFLESYVNDGLRPDEWLMQEWANRLQAAVAKLDATPPNRAEIVALANEVDQIGEALISTNKNRGMQLVSLGARIALLAGPAPLQR
jgi:hypothetical protein